MPSREGGRRGGYRFAPASERRYVFARLPPARRPGRRTGPETPDLRQKRVNEWTLNTATR